MREWWGKLDQSARVFAVGVAGIAIILGGIWVSDEIRRSSTDVEPVVASGPEMYDVDYCWTTTAPLVKVTVENESGGTDSFNSTHDDCVELTMPASAKGILIVQNQRDYGSVTCTLEVDGYELDSQRSSGAYAMATCSS